MRGVNVAVAAVVLVSAGCSSKESNPLELAMVGDWSKYALVGKDPKLGAVAKLTVVGIDRKAAVIRVQVDNNQTQIDRKQTVRFDEPYLLPVALTAEESVKVREVKEYRTEIPVGNAKMPVRVHEYELLDKKDNDNLLATVRVYTTKQLQLGVAKVEYIDPATNEPMLTVLWLGEGHSHDDDTKVGFAPPIPAAKKDS